MRFKVPLRDGQQLGVRVIGKGQPVLLVHGFGSESRHWLPNILPFIHRYQFILPDLRGFGLSHHLSFSQPSAFRDYADDLHAVIQYLQLERFYLGGISTGAYTCLMYNHLYGFQQVEKYLNIEHSTCSVNQLQPHGLFREKQEEIFKHFNGVLASLQGEQQPLNYWRLSQSTRLTLRDTMADLFKRSVYSPLGKQVISSARYGEKLLAGSLFPIDNLDAYFHIMQSFMNGEDTREALAAVNAPIYIMAGSRSEFFSVQAHESILQHAPRASLTVFKRSGHIPIIDRPIAFQQEFTRFLQQPASKFRNKHIRYV